MVQRCCENWVICHKLLENTTIKIGSMIREPLCSEHKTSYRTCLGEFTEFILEVSLTEMSLQRLIYKLQANVRQTFLVFLLHFNRKLVFLLDFIALSPSRPPPLFFSCTATTAVAISSSPSSTYPTPPITQKSLLGSPQEYGSQGKFIFLIKRDLLKLHFFYSYLGL